MALLGAAGNPHRNYPTIHIAGTNGKGSTAAMIASVLTASGYRTGLYTSPHLRSFSERIRIDGKKITESEVVECIRLFKPEIVARKATFFEATTAIAFKYFSDQSVDVAVIETGLGGRLDATNVISPELCVITDIGIDHTAHLGKTLKEIAFEKGGIIKPGVRCITTASNKDTLRELHRVARSQKSELIEADHLASEHVFSSTLSETNLDVRISRILFRGLTLPLSGMHQIRNLRGALTALRCLSAAGRFGKITEGSIRRGLAEIRVNTGLRGRLDVINLSPMMIADVAHNPEGMRVLTEGLRQLLPGRYVVVFGVMSDKNYREMIRVIVPFARILIAVSPHTPRALGSGEIVSCVHATGGRALKGVDTANCLEIALNEVRTNEAIVITGSHYVVGEAFEHAGIVP